METKMTKLYNLLTKIIPFIFVAFGILSIALIALAPFKFDLLSLNVNVLKEVFSDIEFYLGDHLVSIPTIISFVAFSLFDVVMLILMLIFTIIIFVKSFKFLKTQEYEKRKEMFANFSKKALLVMVLASFVVIMNTALGGEPVSIKPVILALNGVMFAICVAMDLVFEKLINSEKVTWLDTGLAIGKRVLGYLTAFILLLSVNKFGNIFREFIAKTEVNGGPSTVQTIGGLLSIALYLVIFIFALKAFRKMNTRGAFTIGKKNPYKSLFVTGIVVLFLTVILLIATQLLNFEKFVSISQFFADLKIMMLVPVLASISMIVIGADKEKNKVKEEQKEEVEAKSETISEQ